MSERIEKLLKDYPRMIQERNCVAREIASFRGVTAEEVIESMYTIHTDGERVRTGGASDITANIAMNYKEKMDRFNNEWLVHLEKKLMFLNNEIIFFDAALTSLTGKLPAIMRDLVVEHMTWDEAAAKYFVSSRMIGKYRKKATRELDALYEMHDAEAITFMLG